MERKLKYLAVFNDIEEVIEEVSGITDEVNKLKACGPNLSHNLILFHLCFHEQHVRELI